MSNVNQREEYIQIVKWVIHTYNIENLKPKTLFQISIDELDIDWNNEKLIDEYGDIFDILFNEITP